MPRAVVEQRRRARSRCRASCRPSASGCRTSCCRACRRTCSTRAWPGRGRRSGGDSSAALRSWSQITPGWTRARAGSPGRARRSGCSTWSSRTRRRRSWSGRSGAVPQPRGRTGAPCSRQTATPAITSSGPLRDDHADRDRAVDREVVGVHRAGARVEPDLAGDRRAQRALEPGDVDVGWAGRDVARLELGRGTGHRSPLLVMRAVTVPQPVSRSSIWGSICWAASSAAPKAASRRSRSCSRERSLVGWPRSA